MRAESPAPQAASLACGAKETIMDKDRIKGKAEEMQGQAKRQLGEITGDTKLKIEGTFDKAKGKTQQAFGKMKESGREALERSKEHAQELKKPFQNIRPKKPAA
jgi:uncharacterized protein YjbJ (UPF0337 family)